MCALAALATGDQHPLLTVIADHSVALLEVIRASSVVNDIDRSSNRHRNRPRTVRPAAASAPTGAATAAAMPR